MATSKTIAVSTTRFKDAYNATYKQELLKELALKNPNQVPKLEKIVLNVGLGKAKDDKKVMEVATNTLRKITGQQPNQTTARLSIATFKLREGNKIGLKVTLRGDKMYEFMDRLITIVLPRVRDFHGVSKSAFDKQGNYSLGLKDQSVFPELSFEETTTLHGMQINFVINNAKDASQARALLEKFGMPFEKERKAEGMAKKSIVVRDQKRRRMHDKYAVKRAELKALGDADGLALLPRNSSPTRLKNRCSETGRPRAYMRRFGLSRISFREHANKGEIPGITKSSW